MKILSRKDIEKIAERVLKAYKNLPENINTDITHIDPELLLTNLLGFNLEYTHLSLDGSILGATTTVPMEIEVYAGDDSQYTYLPPFVLLFIIQFISQLADFRLVIINTVYLQATKEHNRNSAARNKTCDKN